MFALSIEELFIIIKVTILRKIIELKFINIWKGLCRKPILLGKLFVFVLGCCKPNGQIHLNDLLKIAIKLTFLERHWFNGFKLLAQNMKLNG